MKVKAEPKQELACNGTGRRIFVHYKDLSPDLNPI